MPRTITHGTMQHTAEYGVDYANRIRFLVVCIVVIACIIIVRLFILMVLEHSFYTALATGSQEVYSHLFPKRGDIYIQDSRTGQVYPIAMNKDVYTVFADTRFIKTDKKAHAVANALATVFHYDDLKKLKVYKEINSRTDPYVRLEKNVDKSVFIQLKKMKLSGINGLTTIKRFYPEGTLASSVVGFVGKDIKGDNVGRYGIEGYWNKELAGQEGYSREARGLKGTWLPLAGRSFQPAQNGVTILLTIDRTLQYTLCNDLKQSMKKYGAETASAILMNPQTGAIRVMCSFPNFNPNTYSQVNSLSVYNNNTIFTPYESGSVFKIVGMAGALNEGVVTPNTTFIDSGSADVGCRISVRNADDAVYGKQTMTGVLKNSINTGMVFVVTKLGDALFRQYVHTFGFGLDTGIRLSTEEPGNVDSLSRDTGNGINCYSATGSFGQGLTVTPLQLVDAYAAVANGGTLMKPYIVDSVTYPNGQSKRTQPTPVRTVMSSRVSKLLSAMLVSVIDSGQAGLAKVPGYYLGGKTGTAQIPGPGGYTNNTNQTFIGFGPVKNPKFVLLVKFGKPQAQSAIFSSLTAAPTFSKMAKFILNYYQIPPSH